jgi:long-subunit fatty acid transport protein
MKKTILLTCFLFIGVCFSVFSQIQEHIFSPKKMQIGLNVGSSVGFFGNNQSIFSTYFHPTLSYQLRPKLHFQTGLLLLNQQFNLNPASEVYAQPYNGNTALITAGLTYDVNEKLQVSGMIYSNIAQPNQQAMNNFNSRNWGAVFNATYKVTENFHISGSINVSNGRNTMWGNNFGSGFRANQFGRIGNAW